MLLSDDELKRMTSDDRRVYGGASLEVKQELADRLRSAWAEGTDYEPVPTVGGSASSDARSAWAEGDDHGPVGSVGGSIGSSDTSFFGPALIVVGLALVVWGFFFDPSVESSGGGFYGLSDRIVNIGRVADKMVIFTGGFGIAILGSIMTATHRILKAVREQG